MPPPRWIRLPEPVIEIAILHVLEDDAVLVYEGDFHKRRRMKRAEHDFFSGEWLTVPSAAKSACRYATTHARVPCQMTSGTRSLVSAVTPSAASCRASRMEWMSTRSRDATACAVTGP